ncbi:TetR/AcrR family transcriptional regulator [Cytobacillus sp. NCCP-133]|uniref:TetR/AcrR family transcriptional regulator n=1 Tax=Cytobacillus sp. NCCP-133 TaxID=766848 RepID=UPI0022300E90|nr:TetR/AcrR family transcriptional regulator [Cytobacillus sp. NCCP-133]GLB60679.1 putative HTH-type transcriptional regulator YuxN [Cytobacillus sp. NCCP-133]
MNKREAILEAAVELFAEKGYSQTSMQEIADRVGISKGSLYSFFTSKEDLIISIYEHYQQLVFERVFIVGLDRHLPPREKLEKQFQVQFEGILEYKAYMKMHMRGETAANSQKVSAMEHRMRGRLFSWLQNRLLELYGEGISIYKWDLLFMVQSIYRTYMMLMVNGQANAKPLDIGKHIGRQLDLMAKDFLNGDSKPILNDEMLRDFIVDMDREGAFVSFEKREQAWKVLYEKLNRLEPEQSFPLKEAANRISEETRKARPEKLVLKGLFALLKQNNEIIIEARALEEEILPV